ncbi:MAG: DUF305 domain-containing protein [Chloroflexi bacterium]|nr:DUF305 domain-containing protein [Chloroflexota bacterium]
MRFRLLIIPAAVLVLAAVAVIAVLRVGITDPAPEQQVARLETTFMTGMIPHHREAVAMAGMALEKAVHPELRTLAQRIVDSQQAEIVTMTNYLRDWYGLNAPTDTTIPANIQSEFDQPILQGLMPDMTASMKALDNKSGADFEVAFMSAMSQHHAIAIQTAAPVLISGSHEDLYKLASQIVISQGQEIAQMEAWLNQWYEVAVPTR